MKKTPEQRRIERLEKKIRKQNNTIAHLNKYLREERAEVQRLGKILKEHYQAYYDQP